jgi:hypothetical protein
MQRFTPNGDWQSTGVLHKVQSSWYLYVGHDGSLLYLAFGMYTASVPIPVNMEQYNSKIQFLKPSTSQEIRAFNNPFKHEDQRRHILSIKNYNEVVIR